MSERPEAAVDFADVPDPAKGVAGRAAPPAKAPTEVSPTRPQLRKRILLVDALAVAWLVATMTALGLRSDATTSAVVLKLLVWTAFALGAWFLIGRRTGSLGPSARLVQVVVFALPLAFAAVALAMGRGAPDDGLEPRALLGCSGAGIALAVGPLAAAALASRRAFAVAPAWRGAALGAMSGFLASILIQAHCTVDACAHVVLAHGAPIVVGALLGAFFGGAAGRV